MSNVLIIGPHPDDQEIGMGGTIALLADQGHDVLLLDLTDGCPTPVGDRTTRLAEAEEARGLLARETAHGKLQMSNEKGIVRRRLLDLPNRRLVHSLDARHAVAGVIRAHQASILFMPHPEDAHPDHIAATRIAEDARFDAKLTGVSMPGDEGRPPIYPRWLFYYYCSHLRSVPAPSFIMDISSTVERKRAAILAYRSQFVLNPVNAAYPAALASQDAYFGSRIGVKAGEPFWCREPLGLSNLSALP